MQQWTALHECGNGHGSAGLRQLLTAMCLAGIYMRVCMCMKVCVLSHQLCSTTLTRWFNHNNNTFDLALTCCAYCLQADLQGNHSTQAHTHTCHRHHQRCGLCNCILLASSASIAWYRCAAVDDRKWQRRLYNMKHSTSLTFWLPNGCVRMCVRLRLVCALHKFMFCVGALLLLSLISLSAKKQLFTQLRWLLLLQRQLLSLRRWHCHSCSAHLVIQVYYDAHKHIQTCVHFSIFITISQRCVLQSNVIVNGRRFRALIELIWCFFLLSFLFSFNSLLFTACLQSTIDFAIHDMPSRRFVFSLSNARIKEIVVLPKRFVTSTVCMCISVYIYVSVGVCVIVRVCMCVAVILAVVIKNSHQ